MAYDLLQYVCPPNGKQYRLLGLGDENCQCVQADDGWIEFRKNRHMEEFYADANTIYRGADTSEISKDGVHPTGQFYIQYTHGENGTLTYGAAWAKRHMAVGETFDRDCHVIVYQYDGKVLQEYDAPTQLVVNAVHSTLTFPQSGITLEDVLELQWGGEEVYYYANGYGLVGWKNLQTGAASYLGALSASIQTPFPHDVKPRPVVMKPPVAPETIPVPTFPVGTSPQKMQVNQTDGIWLLAAPGLKSEHIRVLPFHEILTVFAEPVVPMDSFNWQRVVTTHGEQGWSAAVVMGTPSFVLADKPEAIAPLEAVVAELSPAAGLPEGTNPQKMQVNQTDGIWLLGGPSTTSQHIRVLPFQEVVTVFAEPVESANGFNWQRVTTLQSEQGWSAAVVNNVPSFVAANGSVQNGASPQTGFKLASPVPVPFQVAQPFGVNQTGQPDFYTKWGLPAHEGIDFHGKSGDPIFAAADGTVCEISIPGQKGVAQDHPYGIHIRIKHSFGEQSYQTDYCHLLEVVDGLAVNQPVAVGQHIGGMGATGNANGVVHLHFNLHKYGATAAGEKQKLPDGSEVVYPDDIVDPTPYLE